MRYSILKEDNNKEGEEGEVINPEEEEVRQPLRAEPINNKKENAGCNYKLVLWIILPFFLLLAITILLLSKTLFINNQTATTIRIIKSTYTVGSSTYDRLAFEVCIKERKSMCM